MSPLITPRLETLSEYPFPRLAALLAPHQPPDGVAPLNMSIGEPQDPAPVLVAETITRHAAGWNRYPPVVGTDSFRAACAEWLTRTAGVDLAIDPDTQILPVAGTKEVIFLTALLCHREKQQGRPPAVLIPNPFYMVYEGAARLTGAEPVFLPAHADTGHLPDLDAIPAETLDRAVLFFLCTPANPQGVAADRTYLQKAIALARRHGFVLVLDECYTEIWHGDGPPAMAAQALSDLDGGALDHVLMLHSLSKRSNAAGLRSGFVVGPADIIGPMRRMRAYGAAVQPLPVLAAAEALWRDDAHVAENRDRYRRRFDAAQSALGGFPGFFRPPGGFFLWLDAGDGEAAALALWRQAGLRVLPGGYLTHPDPDGINRGARYVRVALVHDIDRVAQACGRIAEILPGLGAGR